MLQFAAESATSEAMHTDLTVTAPARRHRAGCPETRPTGDPAATARAWHATLDAARDVSVAVGPFQVADTTVDSVALRVGAADAGTARRARSGVPAGDHRAGSTVRARSRSRRSRSRACPQEGGGIEYPGSILMLTARPTRGRPRDRAPVVLRDGRRLAGPARRGSTRRSPPTPSSWSTARSSPPGALTLPGPVDRPTADPMARTPRATTASPTTRAPPRFRPRGPPPGRSRSTPRCAATSTPTHGASPSRLTSPPRCATCRPLSPCYERPVRCADVQSASATSLAMRPMPSARSSSPSA